MKKTFKDGRIYWGKYTSVMPNGHRRTRGKIEISSFGEMSDDRDIRRTVTTALHGDEWIKIVQVTTYHKVGS